MDVQPDPAAVFACALSLHHACLREAEVVADLNLSDAYQGMDEFMREVMRVAEMFETWACRHVAFDHLQEVWPYLLEDRFGPTCLEIMKADALAGFDGDDCLRIAFGLRLPIHLDDSLPLPMCIEARNPLAGAEFQRLRIQTLRQRLDGEGIIEAFTEDDDPCDKNFGPPRFGIDGVREDGDAVRFAEVESYQAARDLLTQLLPGIGLPDQVIVFSPSAS